MLGLAWIDQYGAVALHQHQIATVAELDALDQLGKVLQRNADHKYALGLAGVVQQRARGAHQCHIVFVVVIRRGAHGLAGAGH